MTRSSIFTFLNAYCSPFPFFLKPPVGGAGCEVPSIAACSFNCFCNLKISRMLGLHKVTLNGFMLSLTNIHVSPKNKSIIRHIESSKPHSHVQNVKALAERLYLYSVKGRNSIKSKSMEGDGRLVNRLNWSPHNVTQGRIRGWNDMRGYRNRCPWGEMKISSKPCDHIEAFPFSSTVT